MTDLLTKRPGVPGVVYRMFNAAGDLLYIGCTTRFIRRMTDHEHNRPWWSEVASITVEHFESGYQAAKAEAVAIRSEAPRHNVQHNVLAPREALR